MTGVKETIDARRGAPDENGAVNADPVRIVIAGGGTGGHLFPGIAVAQAFLTLNRRNRILFVSTGTALEVSVLSHKGFTLEKITVEGIKGRGKWNQIRSILKIPKGIYDAIRILKKFQPDLVFGVGSYSAGPVVIGARFLGIKIVLHEQNLLPGITNRILARFADRIYVSFPETKKTLGEDKSIFAGNPIREELRCSLEDSNPADKIESAEKQRFQVLIIGGSQGAHRINMAVMEALDHIRNRENIFFIHQTGTADEKRLKEAYRQKGIPAEVAAFFNDMEKQYHRADLLVCRAGATTIAEITAIGKGALFIPFPHAADNHQVLNARSLVDQGAADIMLQNDLSGKGLAERIDYYMANPQTIIDMSEKARRLGRPQAAEYIVADCYQMITGH